MEQNSYKTEYIWTYVQLIVIKGTKSTQQGKSIFLKQPDKCIFARFILFLTDAC